MQGVDKGEKRKLRMSYLRKKMIKLSQRHTSQEYIQPIYVYKKICILVAQYV